METIDQYHKKQMDYFQHIKNVIIPNFQKERELLKNKLIVENNLEEILLIIDKIKELKQKIKSVKFLEKDYLLKNMKHLEIYYNNKQEVEKNNNEKSNLNDFFNILPLEEKVKNTNQLFWSCNNKPQLQFYNQNECQSCNLEMHETEDGFYVCSNCFFINKDNVYIYIIYTYMYIYMCVCVCMGVGPNLVILDPGSKWASFLNGASF